MEMESPGHRREMPAVGERDLACQEKLGVEILLDPSCLVGHVDQGHGNLVVDEA